MADRGHRRFEILLTAAEAYPALEAQFLGAEHEIIAGFRVFDPWTTLRSPAARDIGDTWFDLIVDTLKRGVRLKLYLSDFDPVARIKNHRDTWTSLRGLWAAAEASGRPDLLQAKAVMHPARVGLLPRLLLWPRLVKEIRKTISDFGPHARTDAGLREVPHFRPLLRRRGDELVPRWFPPPPLVPASHHQKLAVFDEKRLYIGGLDLDDRRYDTPEHQREAEETWHDTQVIVDGPVVAEAAAHLRNFGAITRGDEPQPTRYLLRTLSSKRRMSLPYLSPRPVVSELARAHERGVAQAETLIYLETQFLRDRDFARSLARRAREASGLSLILVMPAAPEDAAFEGNTGSDVAYGEYLQVQCVDIVREAFGPRVFIGSPAQPRAAGSAQGRACHYGAPLVYVHAKLSVFDDRLAIVSSANLNGRSLAWDTEAGLATDDPAEVAALRRRCFAHWLGPDADKAAYVPETACDAWGALAARNAQTRPDGRQGFILPYSAGPAAELGYNLPGVPDEMV